MLLGAALRAGWIGLLAGDPVFDAKTYLELAKQLASACEYSHEGQATAYWPVGYPAALGAFFLVVGVKLSSAWLLNLAAGVGSLFCLHRIATSLGLSRRVADCAVFLAAINPVYITYASLAVTETYFVFLVLLGTVLSVGSKVSSRRLVLGGALFGCAALTRPQDRKSVV